MKILVFEYVSGGGLAGQPVPVSLAAEGRMMLQALLDDLKSLPAVQLIVPLDRRCQNLTLPANATPRWIDPVTDLVAWLPDLIAQCDAVWPVAPESEGLLTMIAQTVTQHGKILLASTASAIQLCTDKLATYQLLAANHVPVVATHRLDSSQAPAFLPCVIKPVDGAGCEGQQIATTQPQFLAITENLEQPQQYIVQPLLEGQAISLSCLFKQGQGWLLCCNQQDMQRIDNRFSLLGCRVNTDNLRRADYQALIERVAQTIPGLWGYVGIDLIETAEYGPLILEINPRLTTSYVGIKAATGINLAEQVLALVHGAADLRQTHHQTISVVID